MTTGGVHKMKRFGKTFVSLLVLALFLLSIAPAALADSDDSNDTEEIEDSNDEVEEEIEDDDTDEDKPEFRREIRNDRLEIKERFKDKQTEIREEFKQRIDNFKEERKVIIKQLIDERQELRDARLSFQACEEDCDDQKDVVRDAAKKHLDHIANSIIKSIERLEDKVSNSKQLLDEEKEELLTDLGTAKDNVLAQQETVAELGENATAKEIRTLAQELRKTWQDVKHTHQFTVAKLTSAQLEHAVEKHHTLAERMDTLAAETDDESVTEAHQAFLAHLEDIEIEKAEALEVLSSIGDEYTIEDWREEQHDVRELFRDSGKLVRDFMKAHRATQVEQ